MTGWLCTTPKAFSVQLEFGGICLSLFLSLVRVHVEVFVYGVKSIAHINHLVIHFKGSSLSEPHRSRFIVCNAFYLCASIVYIELSRLTIEYGSQVVQPGNQCRMFRVFGHEKVWLLDGGLPNWKSHGFPVISEGSQLLLGEDAAAAVQKVYSGKEV